MLLNWFNTREVAQLGGSLADHLIAQATSSGQRVKPTSADQNAIQAFLRKVDREARPLQLNLLKRAKLANSFKWRLLEKGVEPGKVDELTQMLLVQLSAGGADLGQLTPAATGAPKRTNAGKVDSLLAQAIEYGAHGAHVDAMRCYQDLLELDPRHALAHNNLGTAYLNLGRYPQAEREFRCAIELKRGRDADALCNLATVLLYTGRVPQSEAPLRRALKLSPGHVQARVGLGLTLILRSRLGEAADCFDKALKSAPRSVDPLVGLAQIAELEGRFAEAEALLQRARDIDAKSPNAWAAVPRLRRMTRSDSGWLETAQSIADGPISAMDQATLRFSIGKYFDDVGDYKRSFDSYRRANELQKLAATAYDRRARKRFVDDFVRVYTREALSGQQPGSSDSERPVFVVGMIRSGTSLVEQIISSHPQARGAGELEFWQEVVHKHEAVLRCAPPSGAFAAKWAEAYLATLAKHSRDAARVVDKSNFNSDYLGIIHLVFRSARLIHVRRDPIDTCLSCYFQQFAASLNFTTDLADLAHYYREHHRLVDHWRAVLPAGTLLDVPYAELVADPEKWTRRILDFIGLPWDPRCLDFHATERPVLTASAWQVRQRMYTSSVGRWRRYEKFIGPLRELDDLTSSRSV